MNRSCRTKARLIGAFARASDIVENPAHLAAGKIGVDDEAGFLLHAIGVALLFELIAEVAGSTVLPDDGVVDRIAAAAVPDDGGLALVGDADGGGVARAAGSFEDFRRDVALARPDFLRVVLDPSGLGKDLAELLLRDVQDVPA